ncbi:hypothetical protein EJ08DRAFT_515303 [Tothia fuscella]|uniref:Uncharacterized protein n=1 Tax=Tothia fuscella TaxID=1048955 RepID=A0A9P4NHB6_9PEZI|nr:hypothetical protein EJ08DRAFT_515303 [Tothia fuscella]
MPSERSDGSSTTYTSPDYLGTPPETVMSDHMDDKTPFTHSKPTSSVPWPKSTFIIRCVSTGRVITLLDGQVQLGSPGGRGSIHWACVETKGWLGFRNVVCGKFLGHAESGMLRCTAGNHCM